MTSAEIFTRAAELVAKGWTTGSHAKTAKGRTIGPDTPGAACWCAVGALFAVVPGPMSGVLAYVDVVARLLPEDQHTNSSFGRVIGWNDAPGRTQAEVVSLLQLAAETARVAEGVP